MTNSKPFESTNSREESKGDPDPEKGGNINKAADTKTSSDKKSDAADENLKEEANNNAAAIKGSLFFFFDFFFFLFKSLA